MLGKAARNKLLFYITKEDVQNEALERLGRHWTDEELYVAQKGLESGLMFDIDTVYRTIFEEMIGKCKNQNE